MAKKRLSSKTQAEKISAESRRSKVAEAYLKGTRNQTELAERFSVTQQCISKDLAPLAKEWKASAVKDFDLARTQELERLDHTEQAAWDGWERSCTDKVMVTVESPTSGDKPPKRKERRQGQAGDPRFLAIVVDVVSRRCEILGLDAPEKHAILASNEMPEEMDPDFLALAQEVGKRLKVWSTEQGARSGK